MRRHSCDSWRLSFELRRLSREPRIVISESPFGSEVTILSDMSSVMRPSLKRYSSYSWMSMSFRLNASTWGLYIGVDGFPAYDLRRRNPKESTSSWMQVNDPKCGRWCKHCSLCNCCLSPRSFSYKIMFKAIHCTLIFRYFKQILMLLVLNICRN